MKAITREWVLKAEEDFLAAGALNLRRKRPLWNIVSFHVQQAVEKYLKARLEEAGLSIPKTHDLLHLLNLVAVVSLFGPPIPPRLVFSSATRYTRVIQETPLPKLTPVMQ